MLSVITPKWGGEEGERGEEGLRSKEKRADANDGECGSGVGSRTLLVGVRYLFELWSRNLNMSW